MFYDALNLNQMGIEQGAKVKVVSGEQIFEGFVEKTEWDFDQWTYLVKNNWYCQSEVSIL